MKKILLALILLLPPTFAFAETQRNPCFYPQANPNSTGGCIPVSNDNALPITEAATSIANGAMSRATGASASITALSAKATAGNLYSFSCTAISGAAAGFCIAYNGTVAPGTGALTAANVLDFCFMDNTAKGCVLSKIPMYNNYSSGIQILISSAVTPYTYTTGVLTGAISVDFK